MGTNAEGKLLSAIRAGELDSVRQLLEANPGLASSRGNGRTPLHHATDWPGHWPNVGAMIEMLLAHGADPNAGFPHESNPRIDETPLHWAASSNDTDAIAALIAGGAEVDAAGGIFDGCTSFVEATIFENYEAAALLLDLGAAPWLPGLAALGMKEAVESHLAATPPDAETLDRAFQFACRSGHLELAQMLLDAGADAQAKTPPGETALELALGNGQTEVANWLGSLDL